MSERVLVKVVEGKNLMKSGNILPNDPYVELKLKSSGQKYKSRTVQRNLNPHWNQDFILDSNYPAKDALLIRIYDYEALSEDDYVGELEIPLSKYLLERGIPHDEWFPVMQKKSKFLFGSNLKRGKGEIRLIVTVGNPPYAPQTSSFQYNIPAPYNIYSSQSSLDEIQPNQYSIYSPNFKIQDL